MTSIPLLSTSQPLKTPEELLDILDTPNPPIDQALTALSGFVGRRWHLTRAQLDASLEAAEKLRTTIQSLPCLTICCLTRWSKLRKLSRRETMLKEVLCFHKYTDQWKQQHLAEVIATGKLRFVRPAESGLIRAFHVDREGRTFVHRNRKKQGDPLLGPGNYKTVTTAREVGTSHFIASAGHKFSDPDLAPYRLFRGIPGFVQLIDSLEYKKKRVLQDETKTRSLYEYCNGGMLDTAIDKKALIAQERQVIFNELVKNVAKIHAMGLLHRDLNPKNIFLHRNAEGLLHPVIGDLDTVCQIDDRIKRDLHRTTYDHASPEYAKAFLYGGGDAFIEIVTPALDSWSLGCILFALLDMGQLPWKGIFNEEKVFLILCKLKDPWLPEPPDKDSPQHLVWELLKVENRLSATEAAQRLPTLRWGDIKS